MRITIHNHLRKKTLDGPARKELEQFSIEQLQRLAKWHGLPSSNADRDELIQAILTAQRREGMRPDIR